MGHIHQLSCDLTNYFYVELQSSVMVGYWRASTRPSPSTGSSSVGRKGRTICLSGSSIALQPWTPCWWVVPTQTQTRQETRQADNWQALLLCSYLLSLIYTHNAQWNAAMRTRTHFSLSALILSWFDRYFLHRLSTLHLISSSISLLAFLFDPSFKKYSDYHSAPAQEPTVFVRNIRQTLILDIKGSKGG